MLRFHVLDQIFLPEQIGTLSIKITQRAVLLQIAGMASGLYSMKTPERSRTSCVSQIVLSFCPKVVFLLWIERHTQIHYVMSCNMFTDRQTDRHTHTHTHTHRSDSMTSTADAGGKNLAAYGYTASPTCMVLSAEPIDSPVFLVREWTNS